MLLSQITNQNPRTDKLLFLINHWQFFVNHKCHSFPCKHWESDIFLEFLQIFPPQSGAVFRFNFLRSVRASLLSAAFNTTYPTADFPVAFFSYLHIFELVMININTNIIQIVTDTNTKIMSIFIFTVHFPTIYPPLSHCVSPTFSLSSFILQQSSKSRKRVLCHQTHASHPAFLLLKSLEKITLMP